MIDQECGAWAGIEPSIRILREIAPPYLAHDIATSPLATGRNGSAVRGRRIDDLATGDPSCVRITRERLSGVQANDVHEHVRISVGAGPQRAERQFAVLDTRAQDGVATSDRISWHRLSASRLVGDLTRCQPLGDDRGSDRTTSELGGRESLASDPREEWSAFDHVPTSIHADERVRVHATFGHSNLVQRQSTHTEVPERRDDRTARREACREPCRYWLRTPITLAHFAIACRKRNDGERCERERAKHQRSIPRFRQIPSPNQLVHSTMRQRSRTNSNPWRVRRYK